MRILKDYFFENKPEIVAKDILGKLIFSSKTRRGVIVTESEAYLGEKDLASHIRFGRTKRNGPMYMKGGVWYVYLIYGMYFMLNIVTGAENDPGAVLVRGGIGYKKDSKGYFIMEKEIKGPGILTKFLGVDLNYNKKKAIQRSGLYIIDFGLTPKKIIKTSRIGVKYAGEWKDKKLRFVANIDEMF